MRSRSTLTLNQALAIDRLEEFVWQEEAFGAELVKGSDFERALALIITQRQKSRSLRLDLRDEAKRGVRKMRNLSSFITVGH